MLGDRDRLEQLFLNLIVNAADAMGQGGRLTVTARAAPSGEIEIAFQDTGHGIEPDAIDRIFEPFFTTKDRGKGTGLGLVVSQTIVRDHHGSIEVESDVGKGTRFLLRFPEARESSG